MFESEGVAPIELPPPPRSKTLHLETLNPEL